MSSAHLHQLVVVLGDGEEDGPEHLNSPRAAAPALPVSQQHIYVALLQYDDLGPRLLSSSLLLLPFVGSKHPPGSSSRRAV